ncbi:MAG TPA: PIG-L family deacetylase [Planctomycetota bacterium]|nr:PIG-L family deacetylase [Planctomycetota bacterium]
MPRPRIARCFPALFVAALLVSWWTPGVRADNWPAWRGPTGQGVCRETGLITRWSETENVRWKVSLPAPGNSTPIIWEGFVYLTQAEDEGKDRATLCLRKSDGSTVWKRGVRHEESEPTHGDNPYCSASPVTDGERVIVSYGSAGVSSYKLDGTEEWHTGVGPVRHIWGNASSPVIYGDLVLLNCGPGPKTRLLAFEKRTGKEVWSTEIPGGLEDGGGEKWTGSWSTPVVVAADGREDIVIGYPHKLLGFDPKTGKGVWTCEGLGRLVYASPVVADGVIVAFSGYGGPPLAARSGGKGDVTATHRLWRRDKAGQQIGSGVHLGGNFYNVNEAGVAECMEAKTGKTIWQERAGGRTWSSLVLADGKIYSLHESGECVVFDASNQFHVVARNSLNEMTRSSIAISGGDIFVRTYKRLWCLAASKAASARGAPGVLATALAAPATASPTEPVALRPAPVSSPASAARPALPPEDGKLRIIAFGAHPDDCELKAGGVAAKWARAGHHVKFVSVTNGDIGHWSEAGGPLARRRTAEVQKAAAILGITTEVLDIHDGEVLPTIENRRTITRLIREWKADIVLAPRPNDYHPDHRYTGILLQDSAFMVTVPFFCPDVPFLEKNPTFFYYSDRFQRPNPFRPDVVVDIDDVIERKLDALDALVSQFFEGGAGGNEALVPKDDAGRAGRMRLVRGQFAERSAKSADEYRAKLAEAYGEERGKRIQHAEAFELCEYGSQPSPEELRRLFP